MKELFVFKNIHRGKVDRSPLVSVKSVFDCDHPLSYSRENDSFLVHYGEETEVGICFGTHPRGLIFEDSGRR